ncbi:MAG: tRNA adenosine(34) deaminase TadA [Candidatus Kapaibacterium sp.]|jgi:tRNA(adenine34) deaminase
MGCSVVGITERRLVLEQNMHYALQMAEQGLKSDEIPVGAIIIYKGDIIAKAHNKTEEKNNALLHAELIVLQQAMSLLHSKFLHECDLYVTLEPCPMCAGAIVLSRINRVVFGAFDSKAGACGSLMDIPTHPLLNHNPIMIGGILEKECSEILQYFFKSKR